MESMITYRNIYGHVLVPASFVVPRHDDNWPKACWDLPIGSVVQRLRLRHDFLTCENVINRRKQLDGLGFVWDVSEYNFLRFFTALKHFERISRANSSSSPRDHSSTSIRVPSTFVVPSGEEHGWPPDLWGYPLGAKTMAVRQKQLYVKSHPDRKQALEDIGFRWKNGNASLGWLDVVHAAAIYSQMHGRTLNVPLSFTVPAPPQDTVDSNTEFIDSWPWPQRLWGLKLGQRLKDIRLKGAYLKVREMLALVIDTLLVHCIYSSPCTVRRHVCTSGTGCSSAESSIRQSRVCLGSKTWEDETILGVVSDQHVDVPIYMFVHPLDIVGI